MQVPEVLERWPVYREGNAQSPDNDVEPQTFVYEGAQSGRGATVDWPGAAAIARRGQMILAGGLGADNVGDAIAAVRPFGVDVSSGVEIAPGSKDAA